MISFTLKSIFYHIAMILFLIPLFINDIIKIRLCLISAYIFLMLWEYLTFKEITIDERLLINELLRQGWKHQLELKEYLYNTPRREAQAFIGKKEVRDTIFNLHGKSCLRCGSLDNISLDHVIPIYHNGENTIDNLQPLCRSCNSSKGTKIIDYRKGGKQNETN